MSKLSNKSNLQVLYEDNHIIVVNKRVGDIVQGDKTGDKPLSDVVKSYIKDKYNKNNNTVGILDDPLVFPNLFENPSLETSLDFINILINETINVLQNVQKHKMIRLIIRILTYY